MLKRLTLLICILCLGLVLGCDDQGPWEGDYVIYNAEDLNALAGYSSVTGNLVICSDEKITGEGPVPIPNLITGLAPLQNLTAIGGDLEIKEAPLLTSLGGLKNLTSVGGSIRLDFLPFLRRIDAFQQLTAIPGDLEIQAAGQVESLDVFAHLQSIGGNLDIGGNTDLTSLGLDALQTVGGNFHFVSNPALPVSLIEALKEQLLAAGGIGGDVYVVDNYDDAYAGSVYHGNYTIYRESDINRLRGVTYITGSLQVMTAVYSVPFVGMVEDQSLDSLEGLESLERIGGELKIYNKDGLTDLQGLNNLKRVDDQLWLHGNDYLTSLSGLESLAYVGDAFLIKSNPSLPVAEAEALRDQVLARDGIGGRIDISGNLE